MYLIFNFSFKPRKINFMLGCSQQILYFKLRHYICPQSRTLFYLCCLFHTCMCAKSLLLCPTLCSPMDCSLPGFSVHGILQARILEWVSMPSYRLSSQPCISYVSCIGRQVLYQQNNLGSLQFISWSFLNGVFRKTK